VLGEIESGEFAREFLSQHGDPERGIEAMAAREARGPLAAAGRELRSRLHPEQGPDKERSE